jgi:hypothetical protein
MIGRRFISQIAAKRSKESVKEIMFDEEFAQRLAKAVAIEVMKAFEARPRVRSRYLRIEDAATYLNTTKAGVRGMLRSKLFPKKQMGGRLYIDVNDIDVAMRENSAWA